MTQLYILDHLILTQQVHCYIYIILVSARKGYFIQGTYFTSNFSLVQLMVPSKLLKYNYDFDLHIKKIHVTNMTTFLRSEAQNKYSFIKNSLRTDILCFRAEYSCKECIYLKNRKLMYHCIIQSNRKQVVQIFTLKYFAPQLSEFPDG